MYLLHGGLSWIAHNWAYTLAVVFTFGFMIFVHELGHFLMAKRVGITVHEFALGFGPKLICFGKKKKKDEEGEEEDSKETEYCLRLIPLGGFVSMEGEDEPGDLSDPGNFNNKSVFDRLKVIVAGCAMNYITGILLLLIVGFVWGLPSPPENPPAVVGKLIKGYPLEKAGIKPRDKIIKVNNIDVKDFVHLSKIISPMKDGEKVKLTIERNGKILTYDVAVKYSKEYKKGMLGFSPAIGIFSFKFEPASPKEVVMSALHTTVRLTFMPITIVKWIVTKKMSAKEVAKGTAGPIGIGQMIFEVSKKGVPKLMYLCAILSILIGAFNLFPIPALDGSRVVFLIIEAIRKKPVDPEKEGMIHQVGFYILMILVLIVTYNDIMRLIKGEDIIK